MNQVVKKIIDEAQKIYENIKAKEKPVLESPVRALSNVKYDSEAGYFELNGSMKKRTLTASTVKTFAQTLKMMALSKDLVESNDIATKRE